jgi:hypothetical protein
MPERQTSATTPRKGVASSLSQRRKMSRHAPHTAAFHEAASASTRNPPKSRLARGLLLESRFAMPAKNKSGRSLVAGREKLHTRVTPSAPPRAAGQALALRK